MRRPSSVPLVLVLAASTVFAADKKKAFEWPPLPDQATLQRASALRTDSGLVILERRCLVEILSFDTPKPGFRREETIRFLVANEQGARNAVLEVADAFDATVGTIAARTVAPDGAVTVADEARDIKRVSVTTNRRREPLVKLATVSFPAPQKGALLDLHYETSASGEMLMLLQPLAWRDTPSLVADFEVRITTRYAEVPWSAMTFGDSQNAVQLTALGTSFTGKVLAGQQHGVTAHVGQFEPPRREPHGLPSHQLMPMLVCFVDMAILREPDVPGGTALRAMTMVDGRGRLITAGFPTAKHREFWGKFLAKEAEAEAKFVVGGRDVSLQDLPAKDVSQPLEQRLAALYRHTQELLRYDPDATPGSVAQVLSKGMGRRSNGALVLSAVLKRAGIAHQVGEVLNRYGLRFSSVLRSEYLFDFQKVVVVDVPGKGPVFMMPGYLSLPFGALPVENQDSMVLLPKATNDVSTVMTPANPPQLDSAVFRYDLALDTAGNVSGTVSLAAKGAAGLDVVREGAYREFRKTHPDKADRKATAAAKRAEEEDFQRLLADQFELVDNRLHLEGHVLKSLPSTAADAVELTCTARGEGMAQQVGDRWLAYVTPPLAGLQSPFTEPSRTQPIWYDTGGTVVVEGDLELPAGAVVAELPAPLEVKGPEGVVLRRTVEKVETEGRVVVRSRLEMERPAIVANLDYVAWRTLQEALARAGEDRFVLTMSASKVLD